MNPEMNKSVRIMQGYGKSSHKMAALKFCRR
jgi:hypothetical protein